MASDVQLVIVDGPAAAADRALALLRFLEAKWSRFRSTSDITRVNTHPGETTAVDATTIGLVSTMSRAWRLTGGLYDPTILPDLLHAGYTCSISDPAASTLVHDRAATATTPAAITVDEDHSTITMPVGTAIDPGGIGKGLAADLVADHLLAGGARGALVSIGGDIVAAGAPPTDDGWPIAIENPLHPESDLGVVTIHHGGIATSSTHSRRFVNPRGQTTHHLIDPNTGTAADTDIAAVTVIAPTGWQAEAHATALAIQSTTGFGAHTTHHQLEAIAVTHSGTIHTTPALAQLNQRGIAA